MKKYIILVLASFFIFSSWLSTEDKESVTEGIETSRQEYSKSIQFTKKSIHKLMRKKHLPALAITIVDDQDIISQQTFGMADTENNIEASGNTVFKLYSVAKLFTAIEIFHEVEYNIASTIFPYR